MRDARPADRWTLRFLRDRRPNIKRLIKRGDVAGLTSALTYVAWATDRSGHPVDVGVPIRRRAAAALIEHEVQLPADRLRAPLSDPDPQVRVSGLELAAASADGLQLLAVCALDRDNDWSEDLRARARGTILTRADPSVAVTVAHALISRRADPGLDDIERGLLTDLVATCGPAGEIAVVEYLMEVMQSVDGMPVIASR
jgi:hypothetical protein